VKKRPDEKIVFGGKSTSIALRGPNLKGKQKSRSYEQAERTSPGKKSWNTVGPGKWAGNEEGGKRREKK